MNGTLRMRTRWLTLMVFAVIAIFLTTTQSAFGHYSTSHRTNLSAWHTSSNIPAGWEQALINGALVWDNVPSQCHDFQRVGTGSGQIPLWQGAIDGAGGVYAITTDAHNNIKFDSAETWHLNVNTSPGGNSLDLWSIAAHEFGHTLSLNHGMAAPTDTMYATYSYGQTYFRTLEFADRTRIQALYPTGSC
jgi:hypothetical protein